MQYTITEDPKRVVYPPVEDRNRGLRQFKASQLQVLDMVAATVSIVLVEDQKFAFKSIDRLIYVPGDDEHVLNEIDALVQCSGEPNIAQLVGLVVSEDPYKTCSLSDTLASLVTKGVLEYYPGGSLEEVIAQSGDGEDTLPVQWALQIVRALESLHLRGRTHVDFKPANVVLAAEVNSQNCIPLLVA
ncbi:hypothetical protein BDW74DRAFT_183316 [Aspergillus multicolor]|uniref:uncharacterized protein n=1 Tax=Aspergillus multicolor TaxID=41759 RepID=UPI003CCCDC70